MARLASARFIFARYDKHMTLSLIASIALVAAAQSPSAAAPAPPVPPVQLSLENQSILRCSAAFALVSYGQENGNEAALSWPKLDPRGQEFFVRSLAKIMDDTGLNRDQVSQLASREAQRLIDDNQIDAVMPSCLALLETSNL